MTHTKSEPKKSKTRKRQRARQSGFTLVEVMVALPLVALLFGGTITLFTEAQRMVQRTSVSVQANQDSAVGLQYIIGTTREAIQFALPPDTASANTNGMAFVPFDGNVNNYKVNGINTAVEMLMPGAASSVKPAAQAATAGFSILDRSGNAVAPAPGGFDRTLAQVSSGVLVSPLPGDLVCIYRGDAYANASPSSGQYLWSVRRPAGTYTYDTTRDVRQKLCKLILTKHADGTAAADAVQFIGRNTPGTDIPASAPYELEFKLVCGDQTAINGTQTNEAGDGSSVSSLVGKCGLLRNHN